MGTKNNTVRADVDTEDSPRHEAAIDATSAIQERLDYASNAIEFARRQIRDGHPKAAHHLERIAHANLCEARNMLKEFLDGWNLVLTNNKVEPLAFDRAIDDIAKGKWPENFPVAWK